MSITNHIKYFMGFASVTFLDIGFWWLLTPRISLPRLGGESGLLIGFILWLKLLVAVLGWICSQVQWFVADLVARRKVRTFQ